MNDRITLTPTEQQQLRSQYIDAERFAAKAERALSKATAKALSEHQDAQYRHELAVGALHTTIGHLPATIEDRTLIAAMLNCGTLEDMSDEFKAAATKIVADSRA